MCPAGVPKSHRLHINIAHFVKSFTLWLPRSSYDDLVFSAFCSIFFGKLQNQFTKKWICDYFSSDFHKIFKRSCLIPHASEDVNFVP